MEGDAPARRTRRAQATIEFAFSAPLLLLCLFATLDSATWALQNSAAVAAAEQGARLAASAAESPAAQSAPTAQQLTTRVAAQLKTALFGTTVRPWPTRGCPASPDTVETHFGARVVAVCVQERDPPVCTTPASTTLPGTPPYCGESPMVTVRVVGFLASLVPPSFGLGWHGGEVPIDVRATAHVLRFAP